MVRVEGLRVTLSGSQTVGVTRPVHAGTRFSGAELTNVSSYVVEKEERVGMSNCNHVICNSFQNCCSR